MFNRRGAEFAEENQPRQILMDVLTEQYPELIDGSYDCVDRIVWNAYFPAGQYPAGFRTWWRALQGSDEKLDTAHLMQMAGRFSRRLRAFAQAQNLPVVDCRPGDKKFQIAQRYLANHNGKPGLFLILVSKARCPVWDVVTSKAGKIVEIQRKHPMPFVNHYSFHIWDADWGHITIKMSGHPPFGAQIILNGHEYVAQAARRANIDFRKEGNCFVHTPDGAGLAKVADTLSQQPQPAVSQRQAEVGNFPAADRPIARPAGSEGSENHFRVQKPAQRQASTEKSVGSRNRDTCL